MQIKTRKERDIEALALGYLGTVDRAMKLYDQHESTIKVGKEMSISAAAVGEILRKEGVKMKIGNKKFNINFEEDKNIVAKNLGFSDYDDAVLKLHFAKKKTTGEIGKIFGVSSQAIKKRIKEKHKLKTLGRFGKGGNPCK